MEVHSVLSGGSCLEPQVGQATPIVATGEGSVIRGVAMQRGLLEGGG